MAKKESKIILHKGAYRNRKHSEGNKTYRKYKQLENSSYSLKKGKWRAATLINILRMAKIRSVLHTAQCASNVPSDHSQGQALMELLSITCRITWHIKKFLCKAAWKGGSGLAIHMPVVSIATGWKHT